VDGPCAFVFDTAGVGNIWVEGVCAAAPWPLGVAPWPLGLEEALAAGELVAADGFTLAAPQFVVNATAISMQLEIRSCSAILAGQLTRLLPIKFFIFPWVRKEPENTQM
jgi:hypothetical protein